MTSSSSSSSVPNSSVTKFDNDTDAQVLMTRDIDTVHFRFDDKEEAMRGCSKLKALHDACFSRWYETEYLAGGSQGIAGASTDRLGKQACVRETALYQKCLAAKLDALGLSHLTTKNFAKN